MTPEDKFAAVFKAETPPPRDFAFEALMVQRVAAQRLWAKIAAMIPFTLAAAIGLWGLQPLWPQVSQMLARMEQALPQLGPAMIVTGFAGAVAAGAVWLSRRVVSL